MFKTKTILFLLIIGLITANVIASLNPPTSWSRGTKIYLNYTDMMNETGLRNGSISNITWIGFTPEKISGTLQLCPTSAANNATLCYNQTSNNLTISYSGSVFHRILDNRTITSSLPNVSLPLTAANKSTDNTFDGSIGINTVPAYRGDISGSFRVQGTAQGGAAAGAGLEIHPGGTIQIYGFNRTAGAGMPISFQEAGTEKVIFYGNVGICGNSTPLNVLACTIGSATDPIADSWLQFSTPESKIVLGEADSMTEKYRAQFRNTTVYRWKRTANEPERLGVLAEKGKAPTEILAYHDGKKNTNNTALNASPQGVDLGAYIGWLHEIVKGQDMQLQEQEQKIVSLEAKVQKLEDTVIIDKKLINYLYNHFNLTKP